MNLIKNKIFTHRLLIINALLFIFTISCKKNEVTKPPTEAIDYPKAYVVNGASNNISIIDLNNLIVTKIIQLTDLGRYPHHISISPDGTKLAVAIPEFDFALGHAFLHSASKNLGGIVVIDTKTGSSILKIAVPNINFNAVFSPDGTEIWTATATHTGEMFVFDSISGEQKTKITLGSDPTEVQFSKDGKNAFIALGESSFVYVIDAKTKKIVKTVKVDAYPTNVWAGSDGNMYVENKVSRTLNIIDVNSMTVKDYVDFSFSPGQMAYNQTLNELWVCQAGNNKISYFERKNNMWIFKNTIETGNDAHAISFSKNEKTAFIVNQKGNSVSVIDVLNHSKTKDITVGNQPNGIVLKE